MGCWLQCLLIGMVGCVGCWFQCLLVVVVVGWDGWWFLVVWVVDSGVGWLWLLVVWVVLGFSGRCLCFWSSSKPSQTWLRAVELNGLQRLQVQHVHNCCRSSCCLFNPTIQYRKHLLRLCSTSTKSAHLCVCVLSLLTVFKGSFFITLFCFFGSSL